MSDRDLTSMARKYGLEQVASVPDDMFDASLVANLPVEWARSNCLLPVRQGDAIVVLTSDPENVSGQEYLELLVGAQLKPVLAERKVIQEAIERCYYSRDDSPGAFIEDLQAGVEPAGPAAGADDLLRQARETPVTQLVNLILLEAVKRSASDIHFEPFESRLRVRYRIDGMLYEQASPPKNLEEALVSRLKVMAKMDIAEKRLPQDGMARVRIGEKEIDIRVSTIPVAEGERVVLRLLKQESALLPLTDLGLSERSLESFESLLAERNGIIVVCGPTGSGKTTTLYAALSRLDSSRRNILTIEDPIEYQLQDIGQIQVRPKIGLDFSSGLRHILRQDPDVILVGETRDLETAEISIRASLTGHLVFTTLHTNDAVGAILRLSDMGVEPSLLSASLKGVLAQRLVRMLCPECRRETEPTEAELAGLGNESGRVQGQHTWRAAGCPACLEGYSGRTGLFELLMVDPDIREHIRSCRESLDATGLREMADRKGMPNLLSDGIAKVLDGTTSLDELLRVAG